ncbi:MAG: PHP domain-containing protein [Candidatus Kapaibacteriales bacterium]
MAADMHMHTYYSDGLLSPEELFKKGKKAGLQAMVVTDHDNFFAYKEVAAAADSLGIRTFPGMEISTSYNGKEIHLLAYNFNTSDKALNEYVLKYKDKRKDRAYQMLNKLRGNGMDRLSTDQMDTYIGKGVYGRPHVARCLLENGYVTSIKEAFDNYLTFGRKGFVKMNLIDTVEAIKLVKRAGGVSSIAHPGRHIMPKTIYRLLHKGLDGIEYIHPAHRGELTQNYTDLVNRHWMVGTGGSDYHGSKPIDEENFGTYIVPISRFDAIKKKGYN